MRFWNGMVRKLIGLPTDKILVGDELSDDPQYMEIGDFPFVNPNQLSQEISDREQADSNLDSRITSNELNIENLGTYVADELPLKADKKELDISILAQFNALTTAGVFTLIGLIKGQYVCSRDGSVIFQMILGYNGIIITRAFDSNFPVTAEFAEYISSGGGGGDTVIANNLFEIIPGKALDSTQGTILKKLVDGKIPCVVLESIYLPPVDFAIGQFYYNAVENKIYLNAAGSGIEDWTSLAPGQIFKFQNSYWTFSSRLSLIGSGDVTTSPVPFVVGQVVEEVNKVAYIFQPTDAGYSASIQKGFMVHTPANMATRTWQAAMDLTSTDNSWRLPTKAELLLIYTNKIAVGEFSDLPYWTSTDANSEAYCVNMGTGAAELHLKSGQYQSRNVFYFENYLGEVNEGDIAIYSDETGKHVKGSGKKFSDLLQKKDFVGEFATQKVGMAERDKNGVEIDAAKIGVEIGEYVLSGIDEAITTGRKVSETIRNSAQSITVPDTYLEATDAPATLDIVVDIQKNGISIFSTKPKITAGTIVMAAGCTLVTSPTVFNVGDKRTVIVNQVGMGETGKNLLLTLTLNK